jgi:3-oxoacyl-[acyl-carrier protein] reductase
MNKRFNKIIIGQKAEFSHKITQRDIESFVNLTGDDNRIHIDKDFAKKTTFEKPVAHGMLSASFISTIIGTKIPGDGALWYSQTLEFLIPVRVNDEITVKAEVLSKNERLNSIELKTDVYNQNKQLVIKGIANVKIIEDQVDDKVDMEDTISNFKPVAIIIGSTGGIGTAVSKKLIEKGYDIALFYHSNEIKVDEIIEYSKKYGSKVIKVKTNIKENGSIEDGLDKVNRFFDRIDVFVNCATSKIPNIKVLNLELNDIKEQFSMNIESNFFFIKKILPVMQKTKSGRIIFLTTQYTEGTPPSDVMAYVIAKQALNGMAKSLAVELATHGITVNLVSPGMTQTELISEIPEKAKLMTAAKAPLKRLAMPDEVASAVVYLASKEAAYITGETIRINGGQIML